MSKKVAVIGQGYVGLPLAMAISKANFNVVGIDTDSKRISTLNSGQSVIEDIDNSTIKAALDSGRYFASNKFSDLAESSYVLICVPTPITIDHKPDLRFLLSAVVSVAKHITRDVTVIIESTVGPGTTRDTIMPLLKENSGLTEKDFYLSFSPERIDPANKKWIVSNTPKLVSSLTPEGLNKAFSFYSQFIEVVYKCDSLEVAETAKLLENTFRFVNISFINELSIFCSKIGIDINNVINAASTKPHGFMPFYPSIGVGGHCIPVDPLYLANKAREIGAPTRFIDLADQINQEMPGYFVGKAEEKIGRLKGKKVLVIGVSYKPNVADVRETPVEALILGLKSKGTEVFWHDDLVKEWNGEKSVALSKEYDLAILATPHAYLDLTKLEDVPILNTRGSI
jgi:UDP-N-acetyl-D-glucosamine dehydrogenase